MTASVQVSIVVGSSSDLPRVVPAMEVFNEAKVPCFIDVLSAHRSPQLAETFVENARKQGVDLIIAGAGLAAQLPGLIAPITHIPVVGLPLTSSKSFAGGLDALLSITHMPPGVPLLSGGIDSAKNVALSCLRFLALKDPSLLEHLEKIRVSQYEQAVTDVNAQINKGSIKIKNEMLKFKKPVKKLLSAKEIKEATVPFYFED